MGFVGGQVEDVADAIKTFALLAPNAQLPGDDQGLGFEVMGMGIQVAVGFALHQNRRLEALAGKLFAEGGSIQGRLQWDIECRQD